MTKTPTPSEVTPPLKWHGGEHSLADTILELMPRQICDDCLRQLLSPAAWAAYCGRKSLVAAHAANLQDAPAWESGCDCLKT